MFKVLLIVFSALACGLSLIFMLSADMFSKIEEFLGFEFGGSRQLVTVLEGRINLVNDWVARNRVVLGPVLAVLAAINTKNACCF
ncbi:MAG: hypothetical protein ABIC68_06050 [Candidatus Omnitrophota bacterium]